MPALNAASLRYDERSRGNIAGTLSRYWRYAPPNRFSNSSSSIRIINAPVITENSNNPQHTSSPVPTLHASISQTCAKYTGCRTRDRIPSVTRRWSGFEPCTSGSPPSCFALKFPADRE